MNYIPQEKLIKSEPQAFRENTTNIQNADRLKHLAATIGKTDQYELKETLDINLLETSENKSSEFTKELEERMMKMSAFEDRSGQIEQQKETERLKYIVESIKSRLTHEEPDSGLALNFKNTVGLEFDFLDELEIYIKDDDFKYNIIKFYEENLRPQKQRETTIAKLGHVGTQDISKVEEEIVNGTIQIRRGQDKTYGENQGILKFEELEEEKTKLIELSKKLDDIDFTLCIKRGGHLLLEKLKNLNNEYKGKNFEIEKNDQGKSKKNRSGSRRQNKKSNQSEIPNKFDETLRGIIEENNTSSKKQKKLTIAITESFIGGGSANKLIAYLDNIAIENKNITFKLLLEHQRTPTEKTANDQGSSPEDKSHSACDEDKEPAQVVYSNHKLINVSQQENIEIYIVDVDYISGEDVDYQCSKESKNKNMPLKVTDGSKMYTITPSETSTSMDSLGMLVSMSKETIDEEIQKATNPTVGTSKTP